MKIRNWVDAVVFDLDGVVTLTASQGIELPTGSPEDGPNDPTAWGLGNRKNSYFRAVLEEKGAEVDERTVAVIRRLLEPGRSATVTVGLDFYRDR